MTFQFQCDGSDGAGGIEALLVAKATATSEATVLVGSGTNYKTNMGQINICEM